jgi:hypothetical protein
MRRLLSALTIFAGLALLTCPAIKAQEVSKSAVTDQEIELMRQDIRSRRKQIIAANMQFTDPEAQKFWPIYDQYAADQRKAYDIHYGLLKEYAQNRETLTDAQALSLTQRWTDADTAKAQLRVKYFPMFEKAIGGKRAARFAQLDRILTLMVDLQIGSDVPLIQP